MGLNKRQYLTLWVICHSMPPSVPTLRGNGVHFTIYRDLASISFVRCISPIPGTQVFAEGTGFSIRTAIEKCRSEVAERAYFLQLPAADQKMVAGIAAHPIASVAKQNAWLEALETQCLEVLSKTGKFSGIPVWTGSRKLWLGRVQDNYLCMGTFSHEGAIAATLSASKTPVRAILKTWAELRNIEIYKPSPQALSSYTKANKLLTPDKLASLKLKISFQNNSVPRSHLFQFLKKENRHYIAYFTKESA